VEPINMKTEYTNEIQVSDYRECQESWIESVRHVRWNLYLSLGEFSETASEDRIPKQAEMPSLKGKKSEIQWGQCD
jgi:hypothetical protein